VNRLRAFERLTGIDLKKPKEAALAVVALRPSAEPFRLAQPQPRTQPGSTVANGTASGLGHANYLLTWENTA
jgi:hypothetical protein